MTNKDLADLIFPNLEHDVEYYEALYPERNLKEGEKVTRFAPSPTGYLHIGGFFQALIDYVLAKNSNGIFYLRNEDTDKAREVDTAVELIMKTLNQYGLVPDEYEYEGKIVGEYGPYIQSERKEIYHAYIKRLIEIGRAYPCFCTREELNEMRQKQEERKKRTGYYGSYAKCRKLSVEEQIEKIKANTPYVTGTTIPTSGVITISAALRIGYAKNTVCPSSSPDRTKARAILNIRPHRTAPTIRRS